jgi:hypothetical protein
LGLGCRGSRVGGRVVSMSSRIKGVGFMVTGNDSPKVQGSRYRV